MNCGTARGSWTALVITLVLSRPASAGYTLQTIAGTGVSGCSGDGDLAVNAQLGAVRGLAMDAAGNILLSDNDCRTLRRIDTAGVITIMAGTGACGFADGTLLQSIFQPGAHSTFGVDLVTGRIYFPDAGGREAPPICMNSNHRVRIIDPAADQVTTLTGDGTAASTGDGGPAALAQVNQPHAGAYAFGKLYIAETEGHRVRVIDLASGIIDTLAGTGVAGFAGDSGPATAALLNEPHGVAIDSIGYVYICDGNNHRLRRVDLSGTITTVAGTGATSFNGDGILAVNANLYNCAAVAVDRHDNLYISLFDYHRVRKVNRQGIITTVAGNGTLGDAGEGGDARLASLFGPNGLWVDAADAVYLADLNNYKVKAAFKTNTAPVADAGPDQVTGAGLPVVLDGMASLDPEGDSLAFLWTQTAGPQVTLSDSAVPQPTFLAPAAPATLAFSLTVTDDDGLSSAADTVSILSEVSCEPVCGDGVVCAPSETCDDGDVTPGDGCDASCAVEPGYCCVGAGACVVDGTDHPVDPCLRCVAAADPTGWTNDDSDPLCITPTLTAAALDLPAQPPRNTGVVMLAARLGATPGEAIRVTRLRLTATSLHRMTRVAVYEDVDGDREVTAADRVLGEVLTPPSSERQIDVVLDDLLAPESSQDWLVAADFRTTPGAGCRTVSGRASLVALALLLLGSLRRRRWLVAVAIVWTASCGRVGFQDAHQLTVNPPRDIEAVAEPSGRSAVVSGVPFAGPAIVR